MSIIGSTIGQAALLSIPRARSSATEVVSNSPSASTAKIEAKSETSEAKKNVNSNGVEDTRDPKTKAMEDQKNRAREALERLGKELKLVKKIWAHDPKGLAKQLSRITQQLREALELYKSAHEALSGGSNSVVGLPSGVSNLAISASGSTSTQTETNDAQQEAEKATEQADQAANDAEHIASDLETESEVETIAAVEKPTSSEFEKTYKKPQVEFYRLDRTDEAIALRGDFEFVEFVRGLKTKLKETLIYTKQKAMVQLPKGAENSAEFKDAEKVLEELDEELQDFEKDLKKQAPPAVMVSRIV